MINVSTNTSGGSWYVAKHLLRAVWVSPDPFDRWSVWVRIGDDPPLRYGQYRSLPVAEAASLSLRVKL